MSSSLRREIAAVFVFSMAILALELTYTKFFSITLWYHFGFLIVSSAMLGFATAGVALALLGDRSRHLDLFRLMTWSGWSVLISYAALTRVPFSFMVLSQPTAYALVLFLVAILLFAPFFFLGLTISWILRERSDRVGAVYSANLVGSAGGAMFFLFVFDHFAGEIAIFLDTLLIVAAAALVARATPQRLRLAPLAALTLAFCFLGDWFPMQPPADKNLGVARHGDRDVVYTGWSSLSRVDFIRNVDENFGEGFGLWGLTGRYFQEGGKAPERLGITIDANAYTTVLAWPQDLSFLDWMPTTFALQLGRRFDRSLHIGSGGGMDLHAARRFGVKEVLGVEINPEIVEPMQGRFREFSGGIYNGEIEGIEVHTDEGRSFLERVGGDFDLIQLSGIDTHASTQAGAFALAENNLYTKEAFSSYLERLKPGGVLTLTRWFMPDLQGRKTLSLRLLNVLREAMDEAGIDPKGRVFFFRTGQGESFTVLAASREPFTRPEIQRGMRFLRQNGYVPMVVPGRRTGSVYDEFLYAERSDYDRKVAEYPYHVGAPTDDWPFFFELMRPIALLRGGSKQMLPLVVSGQEVLRIALLQSALLSALFLILPLRRLQRVDGIRIPWQAALYFALIGYAYISVEIVLSQKLVLYLGHPTYALSVVLAGVLFFSGIGSALSERLRGRERVVLAALVPVLVGMTLLLTPALDASLRAPLAARVAVVLAFLAPIALLMGFPFPMGVRSVSPALVPYLFGVNGFLSVVGSVLAVAVSLNFGFGAVIWLAIAAYAGASLLGWRLVAGGVHVAPPD